jgi:hypothetical protein
MSAGFSVRSRLAADIERARVLCRLGRRAFAASAWGRSESAASPSCQAVWDRR